MNAWGGPGAAPSPQKPSSNSPTNKRPSSPVRKNKSARPSSAPAARSRPGSAPAKEVKARWGGMKADPEAHLHGRSAKPDPRMAWVFRHAVEKNELDRKMHRHMARKGDEVVDVLLMTDGKKTGFLGFFEMRRALERTGLKLTDHELKFVGGLVGASGETTAAGGIKIPAMYPYVKVVELYGSEKHIRGLKRLKASQTIETVHPVPAPRPGMSNVFSLMLQLKPLVEKFYRKVWRECVDSDDERSKQVPLAMLERILVSHGALDLVTEEELRTLLLKMRLPSESGGTLSYFESWIDYTKFLKRILAPITTPRSARAASADSEEGGNESPSYGTPARTLKSRELYHTLAPQLRYVWRETRAELKSNEARPGIISIKRFKGIMQMHGVELRKQELSAIVAMHGVEYTKRPTTGVGSWEAVDRGIHMQGKRQRGVKFDEFFKAVLVFYVNEEHHGLNSWEN
mmetsp:Transcript_28387/g.65931  ORF Transcript_28387/g.65931 Transcript_28387/m.65931 type:complete len:458 (+) Transcript_28387:3-1376(+)